MKLSDTELKSVVEDLETRFRATRERCEDNRKHFFCDPSVDPSLPPHLGDVTPWQWDGPRLIWQQLKARLTENRVVARVNALKALEKWREKAERHELVMNDGYRFIEERESLDIQGALADGQIVDGLGVLHWVKANHIWPDADDYDYSDDDQDGYEYDEDSKKYRETDKTYQERRQKTVAKAGFPFYVEVIPRAQIAILPDKSLENGLGAVLITREIGRLNYESNLAERLEKQRSEGMYTEDDKLGIGMEQEAPAPTSPSFNGWGETITVREFWTRDEYYEIVEGAGHAQWSSPISFEHHYGMPPFALASADEFNDPDPLYQYMPAIEGMLRIKPALDRIVTLFLAMAEQVSLPLYYWKSTADGAPMLQEDGTMITLSRNSLLSHKAPDGYELAELRPQINDAFVQGVDLLRDLAKETEAPTGQAEITPTSEPWNIRLQQAQANVVPSQYVSKQRNAIQIMYRNWSKIMGASLEEGGFGEPVCTFKRTKNGEVDKSTTVYVEPEDIASLDVEAHIEATSAQERVTKVEHGKGLLADQIITRYEFYEKYYGAQNPDDMIQSIDAEQMVMQILPGLLRQELMKHYGNRVVLGPNGELLAQDGSNMDPRVMLQQAGISPGGGPEPGSVMPAQQPQLNDLQAPSEGVPSLPGMMG